MPRASASWRSAAARDRPNHESSKRIPAVASRSPAARRHIRRGTRTWPARRCGSTAPGGRRDASPRSVISSPSDSALRNGVAQAVGRERSPTWSPRCARRRARRRRLALTKASGLRGAALRRRRRGPRTPAGGAPRRGSGSPPAALISSTPCRSPSTALRPSAVSGPDRGYTAPTTTSAGAGHHVGLAATSVTRPDPGLASPSSVEPRVEEPRPHGPVVEAADAPCGCPRSPKRSPYRMTGTFS